MSNESRGPKNLRQAVELAERRGATLTVPKSPPRTEADESRRHLLSMLLAGGGLAGVAQLAACAAPGASAAAGSDETEPVALATAALLADVNTIGATGGLRALPAPTSGNPTRLVLGTATVGDGGGGLFVWKTGLSSPPADDNATVIKPNNYSGTGRWVLMYAGSLNVSTLAALRALGAPTDPNEFRLLQGRSYAGDGGAGLFVWRSNWPNPPYTAPPADNDVTVITPANYTGNGRWVRVSDGVGIRAEWFGLVSNPVNGQEAAGNQLALQNAVNAATALGVPLLVGPGTFWLGGTINIGPVSGFTMIGAGADMNTNKGTVFAWAGPGTAQTPMFDLKNVAHSRFADFYIVTDPSRPLAIGIRSYNAGGMGFGPSENTFERIAMNGTTTGLGKGFEFSHYLPGSVDANNENHLFVDCIIVNFSTAAWSFEAGQSKSNTLLHCQVVGLNNTASMYGVANNLNPQGYGGSFHWFGGNISNVNTCFALSSPGDDMLIHGVDSEACKHLITTWYDVAAVSPLTLQNVRFACTGLDPANNRIVDFRAAGPLFMFSCHFEMASATDNGVIYVEAGSGAGASAQLIAIGNAIYSVADPVFQFAGPAGNVRRTLIGNTRQALDGSAASFFQDVIATPVGPTTARPTNPMAGQTYFDTNLNKPIWCKTESPATWVDATGTVV